MYKFTDASPKIEALIDLLRTAGKFDFTASIYHTDSGMGHHRPELIVEFTGPDVHVLTDRNGELLQALEYYAGQILGLNSGEHDRICFDAEGFKASRAIEIKRIAADAVRAVRDTQTPHVFPPMTSRERHLLHLALAESGMKSVSTGDRLQRAVVLYPSGVTPPSA
jgi:spoIIIJ-associated protein